ncbi:hypothetical protein [Yoonia sp.]|uniref:hypothetical protein n=1 Tax=Yoonia sp. TaxID=2212373 RepID=UPI002E0560FA|nr:hypothetical protein [Yoonia sp.]
MADWTTLSNGAVGVGGLPSGTTVTALRDNPIAIAEGAAGAPRVQGIGSALTRVATYTATATVSEIEFIDLPVSRQWIFGWKNLTLGSGDANFTAQLQFSSDNGTSYSSGIRLGTTFADRWISLPVTHLDSGFIKSGGSSFISRFDIVNFSADVNAIKISPLSDTFTSADNLSIYVSYRDIVT